MTILLIGYYGFANAGDEAILASLLEQFRSHIPAARIIVASGYPGETASTHQVESVLWNRLADVERALAAADLVAVGGGGLFHDYWGADPGTLFTDKHWGICYYAGCAFLAALHRKPLVLCAVGIGPLLSDYGIRLTRATCEAAALVIVRDAASRDLLIGIGTAPDKILVTADAAFAFSPRITFTLRDCVPTGFALRNPVLGVSVRNWNMGVDPAFLQRELATALDLYIDETKGSVVIFPFQQMEGEREDDRTVAQQVLGCMRCASQAAVALGASTPDRVYGAFRDCQVILGMRLHALIFAATLGIPAVALSYDPKIEALATPAFRVDVKAIDARVLSRQLVEALSLDAPSVAELRERAVQTGAAALQILERPVPSVNFTPDTFDLLRRGVSAQIRDSEAARIESAEQERRILAFASENESLRTTLHDREAELTARWNASLDETAQARAETRAILSGIDRFRTNFQNEIDLQRPQRAWRLMLLVRKAYTLLFRGAKLDFLRWAAASAFGRWGSLDEYEPRFPDIARYLPEGLASKPEAALARPHIEPQRDKYDVLILAIIDFDFRFQRPQQIAVELARRGHRVLWISPSRFLAPNAAEPFQTVPLRDNLWEVHLRSAAPDIYMGELGAAALTSMTAALTALHDEWNIGENIVIVQLPFWRRLALRLRETLGSKLLYDCMDDWETFQNMGAWNVSEEKSLVRECDVLIVTGAELQQKYLNEQFAPVLIRNGADFAFFSQAEHAGRRDLLPLVPHPIVGYFGAIADWIDLDLVHAVAIRRPHYSFVLIGQVFGRDTSALAALPNVQLLGNRPYQDIPAYLHHFDACLIPFLLNQVTKATDPVKLYEYFSLGKPVIATGMAELKQCGDLIYIGRDADDFAAKIDAALTEPDATLHDRRIVFAQANTWAARVDQIDAAARGLFPLVSILIVTYNSAEFVKPCLDSIGKNTSYPAYEVIVVDNASTDGTVANLEKYQNIRLIRLSENTGFAAGNNLAAKDARGDYLVFLNVDTIVPPGWLNNLIRHVQRNPTIGQICPVTNFAGNEAKVNVSYRNLREMEDFAWERTRSHRGGTLDVQVAPLFCSLVPRTVWSEVGELDTSFGMGMFEDDDFSLRVRAKGFRVVAAEDCFVHHFGQGSFSKIPSDAYTRLFEQNRKRIEDKWKIKWEAHRTRPGVRPAFEEPRFDPATFGVVGSDAR